MDLSDKEGSDERHTWTFGSGDRESRIPREAILVLPWSPPLDARWSMIPWPRG